MMITVPRLHALSRALLLAILLLLAARTSAQCATQWLPGDALPGVNGPILATTMWDPDGAGPIPPRLVVAGSFTLAGNVAANSIAAYDPVSGSWTTFGTGMNNLVRALATLPNGDLFAGGDFTAAGGAAVDRIARWNGSTWSSFGAGMNNKVAALATLPNGDLVAAGTFTSAGATAANCVARWNGAAWLPLGAGVGPAVNALAVLPNGDVVAAGQLFGPGGLLVSAVARWNGTTWSWLGSGMGGIGMLPPAVHALTTLPNGDLVAGGRFATADGGYVNCIARWNGAGWSGFGSGMAFAGGIGGLGQPGVFALTALANGDLIAGGGFTHAGGVQANGIARWNGSAWSPLGSGIGLTLSEGVLALAVQPNGDLVAGGSFVSAGGAPAFYLANWNGTSWLPPGFGLGGSVSALVTMPNGDLVAAGNFVTAGGAPANRIARWNGSTWAALGTGLTGTGTPSVSALTVLPNGDLVAGGTFTIAGGVPVSCIARWDGTAWHALGSGMGIAAPYLPQVFALTTSANGDLIAGGLFTTAGGISANNIARWNGSAWSALGSGTTTTGFGGAMVLALAALPNGDVVAGGNFPTAGGVSANCIARWDGGGWSAFGSGLAFPSSDALVSALATLPNGDLIAGGRFSMAGGLPASNIARWNGAIWSSLGTGTSSDVYELAVLPNGDFLAGGPFVTAGGGAANRIARWSGVVWSALGSGVGSGYVNAFTLTANGDVVAGGNFTTAGGSSSAYIARLTTTCPAAVVAVGAGCPSSGGSNTLAATSLPWIGSTFRSRGTGLPALAFVASVFGFSTTTLPLASLLPAGQPGCDLLVSPDGVDFQAITTGTAEYQAPVPNVSAIAGLVVHHQMIPFEVDQQLNFVAITATNTLRLTLGFF